MPEDGGPKLRVNAGYVVHQLQRATSTATEHPDPEARERALNKVRKWVQVFQAMLDGTISVGSRTPIEGIPSWVTLEVAQGGFATGNLLAAGPLQAHELDLLARIDHTEAGHERAILNVYYLSDAGRSELRDMLRSGCYHVNVPEEGALLVFAWLLSKGMQEQAYALLDSIAPFFDRLRFYPVPCTSPAIPSFTVRRFTVGEIVCALKASGGNDRVEQMVETLKIWQPLYDRAARLFLETVQDGWPCQTYPAGWQLRARALLDEYQALRKLHRLCSKPDRPKENFARLRGYMNACIEDPAKLTGRDVGMIRKILFGYVARYGAPESEKFEKLRAGQSRIASLPTNHQLNEVLCHRLQRFPQDSGIGDVEPVASPVSAGESLQFHVPAGYNMPPSLLRKVRRCWEGSIEQLVEKGIIPTGETLAIVLPQITSQIQAAAFADADLRRLYTSLYTAFRRRRSLLLLDLQHQVRLHELPWVAAISGCKKDVDASQQARQMLEQVSRLAIVSFPHRILPNKLLQEIRALVASAGLSIPIVDEVAADIFVGVFSLKFLQAAQIAAHLLRNTLYERYFDLSYDRILRMNPLTEIGGASPEFSALCAELSGVGYKPGWSVARNGMIIEQAQIVTTHNLATLFTAFELRVALASQLRTLAERCFCWICRQRGIKSPSRKGNLRSLTKSAYAWRQMVFLLSFLNDDEVSAFLSWAHQHLEREKPVVRRQLLPALAGLELIVRRGQLSLTAGGTPAGEPRRFLGWTTDRHWMLDRLDS